MKLATRINSYLRIEGYDLEKSFSDFKKVGLGYVDLNYPEHVKGYDANTMKSLLNKYDLKLNGVALRFRNKFINGNLRLVLSVIQRFYGRGENADDLFHVGCVGLIKAIDNFELEQNVQFSTYAVPMIIGEVKRYLRDNYSIRISRSIRDLAYKVIAEKERFLKEKDREPTLDELANLLDVSK